MRERNRDLLNQAAWLILRLCARIRHDDPVKQEAIAWVADNQERLERVVKVEKVST